MEVEEFSSHGGEERRVAKVLGGSLLIETQHTGDL